MKVAVIFDNQHRPETTGFYCRRALSALTDVEHLLPHELDPIPEGLFDLFVLVDDGLDYTIPEPLRPRAAWAIDTHMDLERAVSRFGDADYLFAAQKNGATKLADKTGRDVLWLPLACDPEIHRPLPDLVRTIDIAFVGHVVGDLRAARLRLLEQTYQCHFCQALFDDMAAVYSAAKIGFNCSVADDLNMRLFEIPAHGIPLVTNQINNSGLEDLFEPERHLLTYDNDDELLAVIDQLLADKPLRERIGRDGLRHVRAEHTYRVRMQTLLNTAQRRTQVAVPFQKATDYFEFPRPDVQAWIPDTTARILDVGCGAGALGAALKQTRHVHVTGIELNPDAAARAKTRLDAVFNTPIEQIHSDQIGSPFDGIVLADVLEHLRDPVTVLKKCRQWLADGSLPGSPRSETNHEPTEIATITPDAGLLGADPCVFR